jgi:sugar lactone lactonase YvrE
MKRLPLFLVLLCALLMFSGLVPLTALADTPTYAFLRDFPDPMAVPSNLGSPEGVAVDGAGNVYVADIHEHVVKYDVNGNQLWYVGGSGTAVGQFLWPWGIAVHDGSVYVSDGDNARIAVLDAADGSWQRSITATWMSTPEDWYPCGLRFDSSGTLWVTDVQGLGNSAVQHLTTGGGLLSSSVDPALRCPYWLALDAAGDVYVADYDVGVMVKYDSSGTRTQWALPSGGSPCGIDVDADGFVYVADEWKGWVDVFDASGNWVSRLGDTAGPGKLDGPFGLTVAADGTIYVGDYGWDLVKRFQKNVPAEDGTAPTVDCSLTGQTGVNGSETGWFTGPVTAHLTASDPDDAVASIEWQLKDGETVLGSGSGPGDAVDVAVPTPGDGLYTLRVKATDSNGNSGEWNDWDVWVDSSAPASQVFPPDLEQSSIWYQYTPLQMEFWSVWEPYPVANYNWNLDLSGLDRVEYQIDPATPPAAGAWHSLPNIEPYWPEYQFLTSVSGEGLHKVIARSVDVAGNVENPSVTLDVGIDLTPPSVSITKPAQNGQYQLGTDPAAVWSRSDALSGIDEDNSTPADTTFDTSSLGPHAFDVTVYDLAGNETARSVSYSVVEGIPDTTKPVTSASGWDQGNYYPGPVTVTLTATDPAGAAGEPISGVEYTYYSVDGSPSPATLRTYTGPFSVTGTGDHTVYFYSADNAGNVETVKSATVLINPAAASIDLFSPGDTTNPIRAGLAQEQAPVDNTTYAEANAAADSEAGASTFEFSLEGAGTSSGAAQASRQAAAATVKNVVTAQCARVTGDITNPANIVSKWTTCPQQYDSVSHDYTVQLQNSTPGIYALRIQTYSTATPSKVSTIVRYYKVLYFSNGLQQPVRSDGSASFNFSSTVPMKASYLTGPGGSPVTGIQPSVTVMLLHTGSRSASSGTIPTVLAVSDPLNLIYMGNGQWQLDWSAQKYVPGLMAKAGLKGTYDLTVRFCVTTSTIPLTGLQAQLSAAARAAAVQALAAGTSGTTSKTGTNTTLTRCKG